MLHLGFLLREMIWKNYLKLNENLYNCTVKKMNFLLNEYYQIQFQLILLKLMLISTENVYTT